MPIRFTVTTMFYFAAVFASSAGAFGAAIAPFWAATTLGFQYLLARSGSLAQTILLAVAQFTVIAVLMLIFVSTESGIRDAFHRNECLTNMYELSLALHRYKADHGTFPPAYTVDERTGSRMHSWRVLILPYLDEQTLYEAYEFDEPWDGPNNLTLLDMRPDVFGCPDEVPLHSHTNYVAVVGPKAAWKGAERMAVNSFVDGLGETIMIVEGPISVPWTQPKDTSIEELMESFRKLGSNREYGHVVETQFSRQHSVSAAKGDGKAIEISDMADWNTIAAMLTVAGGEKLRLGENGRSHRGKWGTLVAMLTFALLIIVPTFRHLVRSYRQIAHRS